MLAVSQAGRDHRADHRRFCGADGALGRRKMAADDAAAASLVLHRGKPAAHGAAAWAVDGAFRSPRENRSTVANRFSAQTDDWDARESATGREPSWCAGQPLRRDAGGAAQRYNMSQQSERTR